MVDTLVPESTKGTYRVKHTNTFVNTGVDLRATAVLYNLLMTEYISKDQYHMIKKETENLATGSGSY